MLEGILITVALHSSSLQQIGHLGISCGLHLLSALASRCCWLAVWTCGSDSPSFCIAAITTERMKCDLDTIIRLQYAFSMSTNSLSALNEMIVAPIYRCK